MSAPEVRYIRPGWTTRNVMNRSVHWLARHGVSIAGSRELRVVGRRSGTTRGVVVNVLEVQGRRYLVAPRGTTEWVRNLRAAGRGELRIGRHVRAFDGRELDDVEKAPVLMAYVDRWRWEVGQFFADLPKAPSAGDLAAIAPSFPVFEVVDLGA